ncbi:MAG TPA: tetratricopeptide repeat protein [Acidisarcina sp.]
MYCTTPSRLPLLLLLAAASTLQAFAGQNAQQNAPADARQTASQSSPQTASSVPLNASAANTLNSSPAAPAEAHGRLVLVLPFNNHSAAPNLDWIGESFPEVLNQRLTAAGFLPISRTDRLYALDHLGLPLDFQPSHASTLRIAQMLDADYVVVGSYEADPKHLKATARVLDVAALTLGPPIEEQADLPRLLNLDNSLAWRVAKALDPSYPVAEQTFVAADANLGIDAFEHYIRGLVESSPQERTRHLLEAVRLDPGFPLAWYALGRTYYSDQQYELAANALGHLPKDDPNALAADFYRGLAYFNSGEYLKAEDAFAFVTTRQPLPEVVNNEAVAASRRGKDATPLFEQSVAADPKDPDYHFNLAISLRTRNDVQGAIREIDLALKLRPDDSEAQAFQAALRSPQAPQPKTSPETRAATAAGTNASSAAPKSTNAFVPGSGPGAPVERIKRTYNEASFRQAAFALDQMQAMRLASLTAAERAAALNKDGVQLLNRGLMLEAERQFLSALEADPSSADAHAGLAQVREHTGDLDAARAEAVKSLSLHQNATAHLLLARLDMQANQLPVAAGEVRQALNLDPTNSAARGMQQALQARGQQVP